MRLLIGICALGAVLGAGGLRAQQPPAEPKPSEQQPSEQQPPPKEDDPGKPVLRHGGPAKKHVDSGPAKTEENIPQPLRDLPRDDSQPAAADRKETAPASAPGATGPAEAREPVPARRLPPAEALIEKARDAAFDFVDTLPNFICDQVTKRYESKTLKPVWKYRDQVEVELMFNNGKEDYRNVRKNGKALKKGSPEDSGQWSTGEFGSVLGDIFDPRTHTRFKLRGDSTASGMKAKEYEFSVAQADSHWTVRMGYAVKPAYSGVVWIEPQSGRTLRVEMGTKSLPTDYPVDKVESIVDYEWVNIGEKKYLMPVRSENLACETHMFNCTKNEIEFKNYRKFNVESQVLQVESDISFPDEEDPKAKKPAGKTEPPQITVKPDETPKPDDPPKQ
ncbi:MAG: hypothetical protein ABSC08_09715 [Bryobacteraceae bacterium]|jgi:hypothetical protein